MIRYLKGKEPNRAAFGLLRIEGSDVQPHEALLDLRLSISENSGIRFFHAFDIAFSTFWAQAYPEQELRNYRNGRINRALDYLPEVLKEIVQATEPIPLLGTLIRVGLWLAKKGHEKWAQRTIPLVQDLHKGDQVMPPDQIVDRLPFFLATDLKGYLGTNLAAKLLSLSMSTNGCGSTGS